jgi:hypothetical protein
MARSARTCGVAACTQTATGLLIQKIKIFLGSGGSIRRRPLADRRLVPPEGYLRVALRPDGVGLALGALGMDARRRIDGVLADRASSPPGIEQRRMTVVVPGIHRCVPVGEPAGGSLDRSDRTGGESRRNEAFTGITGGIEGQGLSACSDRPGRRGSTSSSHEGPGTSRPPWRYDRAARFDRAVSRRVDRGPRRWRDRASRDR